MAGLPVPIPRTAPLVPVFTTKLDEVKNRIVACARLVDAMERDGFEWIGATGDFTDATFTQRIGGVKLTVVLKDVKISIEWEGDQDETDLFKKLAEDSENNEDCILSITALIRVFRPVDKDLFRVVVLILWRMLSQLWMPVPSLVAAMQNAIVRDDGNAAMSVLLDNEMVEMVFAHPFGPDENIQVKKKQSQTVIRGVDRLIDFLTPKSFDLDF
jgi:hypothetical protein